ncbi:unnamed protein product, partial [Didymodactylos carnosus]
MHKTDRFNEANYIAVKSNEFTFHKYTACSIKELKELFRFHPREWWYGIKPNKSYPLFVRGDLDGLVALFIDNLATLLGIILSLLPVLGSEIVYGKIVPGLALAMLWGNLYYVYMARKLALKENRSDVTAQPYGINTPGAFAFVYGILYSTYYSCLQESYNTQQYCRELA